VLISVRGWGDATVILLLEGLDQFKNVMFSSGINPRNLQVCSIMPQLKNTMPSSGIEYETFRLVA
jgi:hypothetical protein